MIQAHEMGIVDELRELVSKMEQPQHPSIPTLIPLYESAFKQLLKELDK
jgi:hypothetical protein